MVPGLINRHVHLDLISTVILFLFCVFVYFALYLFFYKKGRSAKSTQRFRARLLYAVLLLFIIGLAKIWVEGFTHILTMLSLVAAGLVVSNKEVVMNVVGGMIIHWRGLFAEEDFVQIQQYSGYVYELGPLYFKLFEKSSADENRTSGRSIKVPNGLVINNIVVNYSQNTNVLEYHQNWAIVSVTQALLAEQVIYKAAKHVTDDYYLKTNNYSVQTFKKRNKMLGKVIDLDLHTVIKTDATESNETIVTLSFYCYPADYAEMDRKLREVIFKALSEQQLLKT